KRALAFGYPGIPSEVNCLNRLFSSLLVAAVVTGAIACRKPPAPASSKSDSAVPAQATPTSGQTAAQPAAAAQPPAPAKPMPAQLPPVLARVNGENVTKVEFDRLIKNYEVRANQPIP